MKGVTTSSGNFAVDAGADRIESTEWLREFVERYDFAWKSLDGDAVAACATEDTIWHEPSVPQPVQGRAAVADFVVATTRTFPDISMSSRFSPVITEDGLAAIVAWRMTGTHLGAIDPPGFAGTGKCIDMLAIDIWQFRSGLIWRSRSTWDLAEMLQQLGIMPQRGSAAERALVHTQRWRSKLGL